MFKSQKGVSLFTVLLFMLVATIAGTATYKWLTSEGHSSESRMLMNEARASSLAGVEALRAWMTYHASDVGSILTQYFTEVNSQGKNKNPISLNSVLMPMAKPGQKFDVTLVGVDAPTTSATYKIKVVSTGYARDSAAKYTETAVLNVAGLYRILRPVAEDDYHLNYHYAYFGGSTSFAGGHGVTSALINGNWGTANGSNPIKLDGDFVVTGNVSLSGDSINVGQTTCVGGNLYPQNGIWTNDLYVGGNAGGYTEPYHQEKLYVGEVRGDAYFAGNVNVGTQAAGFRVMGSMYLGGRLSPQLNSFPHTIEGNLCLGNHASIDLDPTTSKEFSVRHNVWMPVSYSNGTQYGMLGHNGMNDCYKRNFGTTNKDTLFIRDAKACESNIVPNLSKCADTVGNYPNKEVYPKYFQLKGGEASNGYACFTINDAKLVGQNLPDKPSFNCGGRVKTYCDSIWKPASQAGKTCDSAAYFVPDMLMTGWRKFEKYDDTTSKSGVEACRYSERRYISNETTRKLNTCYETIYNDPNKRKRYLFNDYLVLKMQYNENKASDVNNSGAPSLRGKFLFIYDSTFGGPNANHGRFPKTERNARVFVYLKHGASVHINCDSDTSTRNYFFFTKADVKGFLGQCTWAGSVYATASSCAKIPDINGSVTMMYDPDVVDDMAQSGIVCDVKQFNETTCGEPPSEMSSSSGVMSSSTGFGEDGYDADFVSTGTQLYVTVESEYKSSDKVTNAMPVKPSILVMPRAVYLNQDSPGELKDYITVIQRTGAVAPNSGGGIACSGMGAALASGKIANVTGVLPNVYNCTYTQDASTNLKSDFYVVLLEGSATATPMVYFEGESNEFFQVDEAGHGEVKLVLAPSEGLGKISVSVGMSELPSGWTVTNYDGSAVQWKTAPDGSKYVIVEKNVVQAGTTYPLFKITASETALPGTVRFMLQNPLNCIIAGGSAIKSFNRRGSATITRKSIKDYCDLYEEECANHPELLLAAGSLQDCQATGTWVRADGIGCEALTTNNQWKCDAGVGSANVIQLVEGSFDKTQCVMYNPENYNDIPSPKDDGSNPGGYTLYASLKRLHYTLQVNVRNAAHSGVDVYIAEATDTNFVHATHQTCSSSEGCDYVVYAEQRVRLKINLGGDDDFSYWTAEGPYLQPDQNNVHELELRMDSDRSYTAVFNERDDHCFYTEFSKTQVWCDVNSINCIDHCGGSAPCSNDEGRYRNANWIVVNSTGGGSAKPEIYSKNYLKRPEDGKVAMMMNTVEAGPEGTYNFQFWTGIASAQRKDKESLNSGLVVRSNKAGTEYISVSFYGANTYGVNAAAEKTFARICYLKKVTMFEADAKGNFCKAVQLNEVNGSQPFSWTYKTPLNFDVTVDGDSLHITGSYAGAGSINQVEADFDLRDVVKQEDYTLNDADHGYVGLKLGDADFGVNNATWHSKQYEDQCFADPSISCSFAAKYMAGEVPQNESVSPIIGYSNWFLKYGAECVENITYYYNGCDMPNEKYASPLGFGFINAGFCGGHIESEGQVENYLTANGLQLKPNEDFYFKFEGPHGYRHAVRNGIVRNASVKVNCLAVNNHIYKASCGEFYVGKTHSCNHDERLSGTSLNHGIEEYEIPLTANSPQGVNLREADVLFYLDKEANVKVTAKFVDATGTKSDAVNLNEPKLNVAENRDYASRYGFDLEHVVKIILKASSGVYSVDSIVTSCSASLRALCGENDATYTNDGRWRIKANIDPYQYAKKCKVEAENNNSLETYFGSCNSQGVFFIDDPGFEDRLNEGPAHQKYSFKVSVYDKEYADVLTKPTSECIAKTQEYQPIKLDCHLDGTVATFIQGGGVPGVVVDAQNCPDEGCVYDLTLSNGTEYVHSTNISGTMTWTPTLNTTTKLNTGSYSYTVNIYNSNKTKTYKTCNTGSFDIVQAVPASASSCEITPNGSFRAFVTSGNMGAVTAVLSETDRLGNVVGQKSLPASANEFVEFPLGLGNYQPGNYQFVLSLNGEEACSVTHKVDSTVTLTAKCPEQDPAVTNQSPTSGITVSPTVTGCNGMCNWEVVGGTSGNTGTGYSTGSVTFYDNSITSYDNNGNKTKEYTFKVSRQVNGQNVSKECKFKVAFVAPDPSITVSCPAAITDQNPSTAISVSNAVSGCNGQCRWEVTGLTPKATGNNCSSVSFRDNNASGAKEYTFTATCTENGKSSSENCKINVTYAAASDTIVLSTTLRPYTPGSYTLKTGTIGGGSGPDRLQCTVQTMATYERTVGSVGSCTIKIPANNDASNNAFCTLSSNTTYTFVVAAGAPSDVKCGLKW